MFLGSSPLLLVLKSGESLLRLWDWLGHGESILLLTVTLGLIGLSMAADVSILWSTPLWGLRELLFFLALLTELWRCRVGRSFVGNNTLDVE